MNKHGILLLALALVPSSAVSQDTFPLSVELGLGKGYAGYGMGFSGKASVRVIPRTWGLGVRLMGMDGARRGGNVLLLAPHRGVHGKRAC